MRDSKLRAAPRKSQLSIRMRQPRHRNGAHEEWQRDILAQDRGSGIHIADVAQQPGAEPDPVVDGAVRIAGDEVRSG